MDALLTLTALLAVFILSVGAKPTQEDVKWFLMEGGEKSAVLKQLKADCAVGDLTDGLLSVTFGRSPTSFITDKEGTYLFDVYRMVGPEDISHVLLRPATGVPQAPPPPFQRPPSGALSSRELPQTATSGEAPADVFPSDTRSHSFRGSPVFVLEAVGKTRLRVTDVKKLMAHRDLA